MPSASQRKRVPASAAAAGKATSAASAAKASTPPRSNVLVLGLIVLVCTSAVLYLVYTGIAAASSDADFVETVLSTQAAFPNTPAVHESHILPRASLAYVTPWNAQGYDVAKHYRGKFTHVSPVWLQLRRKGANTYVTTGLQDVDRGWMDAVRKPTPDGRVAKVVPRIILEDFDTKDYVALLSSEVEQRAAAAEMRRVAKDYGFDGIVLEVWSRVQVNDEIRPILTSFVVLVGKALRAQGLQFIVVIPPFKESFGAHDLKAMANDVDYFSINTYDFSGSGNPGPNAPIEWVKRCIQNLAPSRAHARKILLGLNFYGNHFDEAGGRPVTGPQYLDLLRMHRDTAKVTWDARSEEHSIKVLSVAQSHGVIYYPSLRSIQARLDFAKSLGLSICIWEIGQGLPTFYDLL